MPFFFLFLAVALLAIGVRGQASAAGSLLASEFTGPNSFIQWFLAVMILGLVGYYKPVRPFADALLGLVIVVMILARGNPNSAGGGLFAQLESAFQTATPTPANSTTGATGATAAGAPSGSFLGNLFTNPAAPSACPSGEAGLSDPIGTIGCIVGEAIGGNATSQGNSAGNAIGAAAGAFAATPVPF